MHLGVIFLNLCDFLFDSSNSLDTSTEDYANKLTKVNDRLAVNSFILNSNLLFGNLNPSIFSFLKCTYVQTDFYYFNWRFYGD